MPSCFPCSRDDADKVRISLIFLHELVIIFFSYICKSLPASFQCFGISYCVNHRPIRSAAYCAGRPNAVVATRCYKKHTFMAVPSAAPRQRKKRPAAVRHFDNSKHAYYIWQRRFGYGEEHKARNPWLAMISNVMYRSLCFHVRAFSIELPITC